MRDPMLSSRQRTDRLLADVTLAYRPQREWIEGRGMLLVVAHFFSGVGAGLWVWSVVFDSLAGLVIALVCVGALAGPAHLLFLGRWRRFWRMLARPGSSWISRGLWGMCVFLAGGVVYALPFSTGTPIGVAALAVSLAGATLILLYKGFVLFASRAIPFWHSPFVPPLYIAYGLRGGAAVLLVLASTGERRFDVDLVEVAKFWVVVSTAVLVLLLLASATRRGGAARRSVQDLVAGRISAAFYGGTVALGLLVPIALGAAGLWGGIAGPLLALVALTSLAGDFYVKYCVMKAGVYVPITVPGFTA